MIGSMLMVWIELQFKRQHEITAYCEHQCGKGMIKGECGCDDCSYGERIENEQKND